MTTHWVPLDEIQGNVTPGFRKDFQAFLFLQFPPETLAGALGSSPAADRLRTWLAQVLPTIASAEEVATYNRLYRLVKQRMAAGDADDRGVSRFARSTWVNIAFTAQGLAPLLRSEPWRQAERVPLWLQAFGQGMCYRDEITGDSLADIAAFTVRDSIRDNLGHLGVAEQDQVPQLVHALIIVGADCKRDLDQEVTRQIAYATDNHLNPPLVLHGASLRTGREPFGFADGISQPDPADPLSGWDSNGESVVAPGELIRGCEPEPAHAHQGDVPQWERYGSYLVFRQLEQDVERFWTRAERAAEVLFRELVDAAQPGEENAAILTPAAPDGHSPGARYAAALMIGRWPSGATLSTPLDPKRFPADPALGQRAPEAMTALPARDFANDPLGATCPMFAHIRKTSPRVQTSGVKAGDMRLHRIVRRGIPYETDTGTGIMFLAYQARIDEGYEVIQGQWANDAVFGRSVGGEEIPGKDPLSVSASRPNNRVAVPLRQGNATGQFASLSLARTVTARGGGYFFAPSLTALNLFAQDGFREDA